LDKDYSRTHRARVLPRVYVIPPTTDALSQDFTYSSASKRQRIIKLDTKLEMQYGYDSRTTQDRATSQLKTPFTSKIYATDPQSVDIHHII